MHFSRPGTGTILGAIAVFIALGGTAFAAGATVVNIADPTTPANVAHVNSAGQLQISGSASVTNTVSTELAAPSAYLNFFAGLTNGTCVEIAAPPSGKAMIVREALVDVVSDPNTSDNFGLIEGTACQGSVVAEVNAPTIGEITLPFDPGLAIPAKSGLSAFANGSLQVDVGIEGYAVPSSQVPAGAVRASGAKSPRQQRP